MSTLAEQLLTPENRPKVVADCVTLIDEEVHAKSGLSGATIKVGYGMAKTFKPGFVKEVVEGMIDDFVAKLEPFYAARDGRPVPEAFADKREQVAEALLAISDDRAQTSKHGSLRKMYDKLRPSAKRNVEAAVPRIGGLVAKYAAA